MKKNTLSILLSLIMGVSAFAQTLPDGMVSLLPDGVTANITGNRKQTQEKNLVVAGEKTKGYKAFFAATEETHGEELWVTDGTANGTFMVKDINSGTSGSDICWMERFNDKVVFGANDGTNGLELWISDGTEDGTYMVKNIHEYDGSEPRGFVQVNETQFVFAAKSFDSENYSSTGAQWWLWVSDGTESGTQNIYECAMQFPGQDNNTLISPYCRVGRKVFFKADNKDGTTGGELWVTDGTTDGTALVKDINTEEITTGTANSAIDNMVNFYNEKLFFKAFSIESSNEPWCSDGTADGTYQIYDSNPTSDDTGFPRGGGASDCSPFPYNGKIYFRGYSTEYGYELACSNLEKEDFTIFDINKNDPTSDNSSYADAGVVFDSVYMFCAATGFDASIDGNYGGELHYTDGETITMQSDLGTGTLCNWVKELTVVSGSLYWWNESAELTDNKTKLFRIDNKEEFPVRVANLYSDGDGINTLRNLDGDLIFTSSIDNQLYCYHYRKDDYDSAVDSVDLDIEYRTRAEISEGTDITSVKKTSKDVVIYPNPASNEFSFRVSGDVQSVKIYNLAGVLVENEENPSNSTVNVSSLESGIYMVLITATDGVLVSNLIINK